MWREKKIYEHWHKGYPQQQIKMHKICERKDDVANEHGLHTIFKKKHLKVILVAV